MCLVLLKNIVAKVNYKIRLREFIKIHKFLNYKYVFIINSSPNNFSDLKYIFYF